MASQTKRALSAPGTLSWWASLNALYRYWKARRLRAQTRRILSALNDERLRDIGLTREDIERYW